MNADLEMTLEELDPACRAVVARLRAAREVTPRSSPVRIIGWRRIALLAASLLMPFAFAIWFCTSSSTLRHQSSTCSYGAREYHLSPDEMIVTQHADGSWQNDFLTRRNCEALSQSDDPRARIACKKALRNLRTRGVL